MNSNTQHALWPGPNGPIEVAVDLPAALSSASSSAEPTAPARGLALIAHPHPLFGGTLDNKVVQTIARAFLLLGYACVRINFRGVGQSAGVHDDGRGELDDLAWTLDHALATVDGGVLTGKPVALAGFSFGAFVTSHLAARLARQNRPAERVVLVGTAASRFAVAPVPADTLVIHGEQDDTVPLQSVFDWARPQNLPIIVLPGVGHFFHGRLPQLRDLIVEQYPKALPATSFSSSL